MLSQRAAIIIGGGRGIGAAIARGLSVAGTTVFICYKEREDDARKTAQAVTLQGGRGVPMQLDARCPTDVRRVFEKISEDTGHLDWLINCAHTPLELGSFEKMNWTAVDEQVRGTLKTAFECCQEALPLLRNAGGGAILNVSSVTVVRPQIGYLHRNVAKAALEEFTRCLARELAPDGIRVNALSVGWTDTDQARKLDADELRRQIAATPFGRMARPDEIARTACFLLSDSASYITGVVFPVDGGIDGNLR